MNAFGFHNILSNPCPDSTLEFNKDNNNSCFYVCSSEPSSVLDSSKSPLSSTTMSSSLGGTDEWESQQQSMLSLIMGEDPCLVFQNGGFLDQSFNFDGNLVKSIESCSDFTFGSNNASRFGFAHNMNMNHLLSTSTGGVLPVSLPFGDINQQRVSNMDEKSSSFDSHNQARFSPNQCLFMPVLDGQMQEHILPPPPKRLNSGGVEVNFQVPKDGFSGCGGTGEAMFFRQHQQLQPDNIQQRTVSPKQKMMTLTGGESGNNQLIVDQLFRAAEYIETGNSLLAQEILARLNQHLLPYGKAFHRAAYYVKEALQMILHLDKKTRSPLSHFDVIFKIGAYKSLSEVSPVIQFANLTCNQAILEAVEGFDKIHIIDFDIGYGYGGQWSSFMQELALRKGGAPTLKITAFSSPFSHDHLELGFTRECLKDFAQEVNIPFELEIVNLESMNAASWPLPIHVSPGEAVAVNLPVASFSKIPLPLPVLLSFVKQLSPKIMVSLDLGCERTEFRFPNMITHALQSYSSLLESLDAVNVNADALQKIERFLLQPSIENLVLGHQRYDETTHRWRSLFLSSGFSPIKFSNLAESQAECLLQRTTARGFQVGKRQSSLVLSWQRKELISASAWKC